MVQTVLLAQQQMAACSELSNGNRRYPLFFRIDGQTADNGYCFLIGLVFDAMYVVYKKLRKRIIDVLGKSEN